MLKEWIAVEDRYLALVDFVESSMDRRLPSLLSPHSIEDTFEVPMFLNVSMKS